MGSAERRSRVLVFAVISQRNVFAAFCAGIAGLIFSSNVASADSNAQPAMTGANPQAHPELRVVGHLQLLPGGEQYLGICEREDDVAELRQLVLQRLRRVEHEHGGEGVAGQRDQAGEQREDGEAAAQTHRAPDSRAVDADQRDEVRHRVGPRRP